MKKVIIILIFFYASILHLLAVPANPNMIHFIQSDGTELDLYQKGDEFFHWAETSDGYTILNDGKDIYFYATLDSNGDMGRTDIQAHNPNERSVSEIRFLNNIEKNYFFSQRQVETFKRTIENRAQYRMGGFPTTGTNNLLMILVNFSDTSPTYSQSDFDNYMNQNNYNGIGSFRDYYLECSYGQLIVNTTVSNWVTVSNTHDYYGNNGSGGQGDDLHPRELVLEACGLVDASVNFADFDNDNDDIVDGIAVIHQGSGEESGGASNIWSHNWKLSSLYSVTQRTFDGVQVDSYTIQPETDDSGNISTIGVMCHEFGHNLGAPDFYDTDKAQNGQYDGTGKWDLMAQGSWNGSPSGSKPAHHNAFTKWYYFGWCTPNLLTSPKAVTMGNSVDNSTDFYYYTTTTSNEYFLLENRQQTGFDGGLPGHGLLILHVDQNYIDLHYTSNSINTTSHQGLYPKAANGTINSSGCPFPTLFNDSFTDTTTPNSKSWANTNTNKPIEYIQEDSGIISFSFMCDYNLEITSNLYENQTGPVTFSFTVPSDGNYYLQIWDDNMISAPEWSWSPDYWPSNVFIGSNYYSLNAAQQCDITFNVLPNSDNENFYLKLMKQGWTGGYWWVYTEHFNLSTSTSLIADFTANPTSGYAPLPVQFSNQSTGNVNLYLWDFGDGNTSTQENPNHTYQNSGSYDVTLTVSNGDVQNVKTRSNYIQVNTQVEPTLTNGYVTPNPGTAGDNFSFYVTYTDPSGNNPSDVKLKLTTQTYSMSHVSGSVSTGAVYKYERTISNTGTFLYHFEANSGQQRFPETVGEFLHLNVNQSSVGWDIRITEIDASPNPLPSGGDVDVDFRIHNYSNPNNNYNNVEYDICLYSPSGNLLDSDNGTTGTINQGQYEWVDGEVTVPSQNGIYTITATIYPDLDENFNDNSISTTVYVGASGDIIKYLIPLSHEVVQWSTGNNNQFQFNGNNYYLHTVTDDYIRISTNNNIYDSEKIYENDFKLFSNDNTMIINQYCNHSSSYGDECWMSFGSRYYGNEYKIDIPQITGYKGETVTIHAHSSGNDFNDNDPDFYNNSSVEGWFDDYDLENSDKDYYAYFDIPNNQSAGNYNFYIDLKIDNPGGSWNEHLVHKCRITVLSPPPNINSLSSNSFSADDIINITGTNFGSSGTIKFGSLTCPAGNIQSWNNSSIELIVPEGVQDGSLIVTNSYGTSNGISYQIISSTGDPELIQPIPDQSITAGTTQVIADLTNTFWNPNSDNLNYNVIYTSTNITHSLTDELLSIIANDNINEVIPITVEASDPDVTVSDDFVLTVNDINDPPNIDPIPDQSFAEDGSLSLDFSYLSTYVIDPDNDFEDLTFDVVEPSVFSIQISGSSFNISAPDDWFGTEPITISASDLEFTVNRTINIIVNPVNDPPILDITNDPVTFLEDGTANIDFSPYCQQTWGENDNLTLSADPSTHIVATINSFLVTFETNTPDWNGTEQITFHLDDNVAGDDGGRDIVSQTVDVIVVAVNDPPLITDTIPNQSFNEDEFLVIPYIYFNNYFYDPDNSYDEITYDIINYSPLTINNNGTNFNISAPSNWHGSVNATFTAADNQYTVSENFVFDVVSIPENPIVETLDATNVLATSAQLNGTVNPNGLFTNYYFEYGKTTFYGNSTPTMNLNAGLITINVSEFVANLEQETEYHFRLVGMNNDGTSYGDDKIFTTLNEQVIVVNQLLPENFNVAINETDSLQFLFSGYDPDGNDLEYLWKLDGVTTWTDSAWYFYTDYNSAANSPYSVTLDVTDNFGRNSLFYEWTVIVNDVDRPIIMNYVSPDTLTVHTLNENETMSFEFSGYDPDGNVLEYTWKIDGTVINGQSNDVFNYTPDFESAGDHVISLEVTDNFGGRNTLIISWQVHVNDVDRAIVITSVNPDTSSTFYMDEGTSQQFYIVGHDPDGNDLDFTWILDDITVYTDSIYNYNPDYFSAGDHTIHLTISDNYGGKDTQSILWQVHVNDVDQTIVVNYMIPDPSELQTVDERDTLHFEFSGFDPDGNPLEYIWELDDSVLANENDSIFDYVPDYISSGMHTVDLLVKDNYTRSTLSYSWNVEVIDVTIPGRISGYVTLYPGGSGDVGDVELIIDTLVTPIYPNDYSGYYITPELIPGSYNLSASLQDYFDSTMVNIAVCENDTTENVNFTLYPCPILTVDTTDISVGILHPNDPFSHTFTVSNDGPGILSGTISVSRSWINSIIPSVFELYQNENIEITISGNIPSTQNEYEANIFVNSNISSETLYVHGWCTETAGLIFTFDNEEIIEENNEKILEFDVMIRASEPGNLLGDAMVYISYNAAAFGENIYANNSLTVTKGELIMAEIQGLPVYLIENTIDNTSSKFAVTTIYYWAPFPNFATEIPTTSIQYLHIRITWQDESEYSQLSFDNDLMNDQQYLYENSSKFYPVITNDYLSILPDSIPNPPQNVTIMIVGNNLSITWDPADGATSYSIYSSDDPFTGYTLEASGITNTYWNKTIQSPNKKFYYVVSHN